MCACETETSRQTGRQGEDVCVSESWSALAIGSGTLGVRINISGSGSINIHVSQEIPNPDFSFHFLDVIAVQQWQDVIVLPLPHFHQ